MPFIPLVRDFFSPAGSTASVLIIITFDSRLFNPILMLFQLCLKPENISCVWFQSISLYHSQYFFKSASGVLAVYLAYIWLWSLNEMQRPSHMCKAIFHMGYFYMSMCSNLGSHRDGKSVQNSTDHYFSPKNSTKMRISRHISIRAKTA